MKKRVSVAMAVYNSEKYINGQIDSILRQLGEYDELVISYNVSNDRTWDIINDYSQRDKRIKIFTCDKTGVQNNFENAIKKCKGEYIFLSDHDDIWMENKIEVIINNFNKYKNIHVISHSRHIVNSNLSIIKTAKFNLDINNASFFRNFISNKYCGSCMAFKREILNKMTPIPKKVIYHDYWIGILSSIYYNVLFINDPLIYHRRHGNNASSDNRRRLYKIIIEKIVLLILLLLRIIKNAFSYKGKRRNER